MQLPGSLAVLRGRVDFSPFEYPNESGDWLRGLNVALKTDPGILGILGPTGLDVRQINGEFRILPDPLTLGLAALASSFRHSGRKIALSLPVGGRHLPLIFAAVGVIADALEADQPSITRKITSGGVLIVSKDLDLRSRYCDLFIKGNSLESAYPGSRLKKDGSIAAISTASSARQGKGVCFYSPWGAPPPTSIRPHLAVLDLRYSILQNQSEDLLSWICQLDRRTAVIALYSTGDYEASTTLRRFNFETLPIDHQGVAEAASCIKPQTSNSSVLDLQTSRPPTYLARDHEIICVNGKEVEAAFTVAAQMLEAQSRQDNVSLRRARWLCATLSRLPVPPAFYDRSAVRYGRYTLRRLIDHLTVRHEAGMGIALQSLKMQFDQILSYLATANPRSEALASLLPPLIEESGSVLLLVRDNVAQHALQDWLKEEAFPNKPWIEAVEVRSCVDFFPLALKRYPLVIVNGALPSRFGWIIGSALGDSVKFLSYASEMKAIESQLKNIFSDDRLNENGKARQRFFLGANPTLNGLSSQPKRLIPNLVIKQPSIRPAGKPTASAHKIQTQDLRDLSQVIETAKAVAEKESKALLEGQKVQEQIWQDEGQDESQITDLAEFLEGAINDNDPLSYKFAVNCQKQGHKIIWLAATELVECIKKVRPGEICECTPDELGEGDMVVLIEESARGSLFDRVVELAQNQPELQYIATFRRQWREAMKRLGNEYYCFRRGYSHLHNQLRAKGSTISTAISVRNWILGYVMGPTDISSIRAVGLLTGLDAIVRDADKFDKAFKTIRKIHQALGRKLAVTLSHSSRLLLDDDDNDEHQRESLWLPVNDILDTVDLAEIRSRSKEPSPFPAQANGRLLPTIASYL